VLHESYVEVQIRLIEASSEVKALVKENENILRQQQTKEAEIRQLDEHYNTLRHEIKRLVETTQQSLNSLTTEERGVVSSYKHLATVEELELEIQSVNARLGMMAEGNSGVIKAFEKREEEIQALQTALQDLAVDLTENKEKITEIRSRWEPELDALVAKISDAFAYNFQQIGCVGEVNIHKDEDFDNWSAQIVVRFR
jgi:chromosome segregation ATPase